MYQNPGMELAALLQSEEFSYAKSEAVSDEAGEAFAEFTI